MKMTNKILTTILLLLTLVSSSLEAKDLVQLTLNNNFAANQLEIFDNYLMVLTSGSTEKKITPKLLIVDKNLSGKKVVNVPWAIDSNPFYFVKKGNSLFFSLYQDNTIVEYNPKFNGLKNAFSSENIVGQTNPQGITLINDWLVAAFSNYETDEKGLLIAKNLKTGKVIKTTLPILNPRQIVKIADNPQTLAITGGNWGEGKLLLYQVEDNRFQQLNNKLDLGKFPWQITSAKKLRLLAVCDSANNYGYLYSLASKRLKTIKFPENTLCSSVANINDKIFFTTTSQDGTAWLTVYSSKGRKICQHDLLDNILSINDSGYDKSLNRLYLLADAAVPRLAYLQLNSSGLPDNCH